MEARAVRWRRVEGDRDGKRKKRGALGSLLSPHRGPSRGGRGVLDVGPSQSETSSGLINDREAIVFITASHQP